MYTHLCISFLLLFSVSIQAMKVSHKIDPSFLTASDHLQNALNMLEMKNPGYTVFNNTLGESEDIKNLSLLTPHLKKYIPKDRIKKYEKQLSTLYLITLRHRNTLSTAENTSKYVLIDIKRFHVTHLKKYPQSIKEKCSMLTHYFSRPPFCLNKFLSKIPEKFHSKITNLVNLLQNSRITDPVDSSQEKKEPKKLMLKAIFSLDKSNETGYFILLRYKISQTPGICNDVFELQSMKQFCWNRNCTTLQEYYNKFEELFKKELKPQES